MAFAKNVGILFCMAFRMERVTYGTAAWPYATNQPESDAKIQTGGGLMSTPGFQEQHLERARAAAA
jgi:hypothetical protein